MSSPTTDTTRTGRARSLDFEVDGMTCGSCAARIEKTLAKHSGVTGAEVNFATGKARVQVTPDVDEAA
ncbi:MAG: cation transporter, partial [Haloechinothrix sp.]